MLNLDVCPPGTLTTWIADTTRVLVVCGRLLEGYDNKNISVCGIARNVGRSSKVIFTQFVGRCLRRAAPNDPITATIISHQYYNQRANFDALDEVTEVDMEDD